ncbi:MAG: hypothetical protein ABSB39_14635 [Candidatus Sulfotelmatobacter sp.]|jgi:hypothetical protein
MSRKKKKPSWGAFPVMGAIKTGEVKIRNTNVPQTRAEFFAEEARRDEEQRLKVQAFWGRPQSDLVLVTLKNLPESAADAGLGVDDGPCTDDVSGAAHEQWTVTAPAGLNEEGHRRLLRYGITQLRFGKNMGTVSAWQACHDRLVACDCYGDELANQPKKPESAPKPTTLDNVLNSNNGETTEGRKAMINAVQEELVYRDYNKVWSAFASSLYENFNGFMLTERQKVTFYDTMIRRNKNFNRPADYDAVRVALVKSGDLPSHLLYPAEKLALEVEDADMNDFNVRQAFARRTRQLANQN